MKRTIEIQITLIFCILAAILTPTVAFAQQSDAMVSPAQAQIVGGQAAERNEFPWQAMLYNPYSMHVCSGSLIRPNWVLTAAHCLDDAGIAKVTLGGYDTANAAEAGRQTFAVKRVIIHPDFSKATLINDIGLIELDGAATMTENVQLVSMISEQDSALVQPGVEAVVSGWGATQEGGWMTTTLNKVSVPFVTNEACSAAYGEQLQDGMTCAGYPEGGKDSCSGDSGGPLMVSNGDNGLQLAGVVSWGRGCARENAYGIYTNVVYFNPWIAEHLASSIDDSTNPSNGSQNGSNGGKQQENIANFVFLPIVSNN